MVEVAVLGAAQLVHRAMLMHQPDDFVGMTDEVGRELGGDHQIDRATVALAEIEQAPCCRLCQDFFLWIPLERHADQFGVVAALSEVVNQRTDERLRAAGDERHLGFADENRVH